MDGDDLEIDDIVLLNLASSEKSIVGTIAFIGKTEFSPGDWLGLILVPECRKFAKNNGSVQGKQYFKLDDVKGNIENFGIFVRPEKVTLISPENLVKLTDISSSTKIKLLLNHLIKLQFKYTDSLAKVEVLQVEYDNVLFHKNEILSKYNELNINFQVLESLQTNTDAINVQDQKLKLTIEHMKNDYQERENDFLQKIQLLKNDVAILQSKLQLNPDESNKHILEELKHSEELIEKLTIENTNLLLHVEEIDTLNSQLESKLKEQIELLGNLEKLKVDLTNEVKELKLNLQSCNNNLEEEKVKNNSLNKELLLVKQTQDFSSTGLYSNLITSLNSSSIQFSEDIAISVPKHKDLIKFYYSSLQLLSFTKILKEFTKLESWSLAYKQLDFLVNLLPFDVSHYFLKLKDSISSINALILYYLEANDEMNDINLITTISTQIPLDISDNTLQNSFDRNLYNRELAIFMVSEEHGELREKLLLLRKERYGLTNFSLDSLLRTGEFDTVKLSQIPIWEYHEIVHNVVDTTEIDNLKTKVKVLQSKLLDDKKFHQEIIDLHKKITVSNIEKQQLETKLKQTATHEIQLQNQIDDISVKLEKYGIDNINSVVDEYEVLEKRKLLETIKFQRSLLNKLTARKTADFQFTPLEPRKTYKPAVPTSIFRRIDKLFDINLTPLSTSKNNYIHKEQQLLEYLNLY